MSCSSCNTKKGDELLKDMGVKLKVKPCQPKNNFFMIIKDETPEDWVEFLAYQ